MNKLAESSNRSQVGLLVATVTLGAAGVACTPDVTHLRREGMEQFRNRQYLESMATLRHALELAPNDAPANYYMGLNYRALAARRFREDDVASAYRQLDTAILYFTQAIKSWPSYLEAIASKNESLEARGKYAEALALAERVAENNRGEAAEHFIYLGNEYRERGDHDSALRAYKIALASDPQSSRAYAAMAKLYQRIGDLALAEDAYRRAYELNPAEPGVAEQLARLERGWDVHPAADENPWPSR